MVWSSAADDTLGEASSLAGGPISESDWVFGPGSARLRTVRLEAPNYRMTRSNVADSRDVADALTYQDFTVAPVLDMRRSLKVVVDVLDGILRCEVSLSRVSSTDIQSDGSLGIGPIVSVRLICTLLLLLVWDVSVVLLTSYIPGCEGLEGMDT